MAHRSSVAVLGGTFDRLHAGHRRLLDVAFASARKVGIGVTTDRYLATHPKPRGRTIASYTLRRRALEKYLARRYGRSRWWIAPLENRWGRSVEPGIDLLVISADTAAGGRSVNRERRRRGLAALPIRIVPLARAQDGIPIASRRIRAGAIDPEGRRLRPLVVELDLSERSRSESLKSLVREFDPQAKFRVRRGTPDRPHTGHGHPTVRGRVEAPPTRSSGPDLVITADESPRKATVAVHDSVGRQVVRSSTPARILAVARASLRRLLAPPNPRRDSVSGRARRNR